MCSNVASCLSFANDIAAHLKRSARKLSDELNSSNDLQTLPDGEATAQSNRFGRILLSLACLTSLLLMVPMWTAGPLVLDEHGSYWMIDSDLPGTTLERSLNYTAIPPLSGWLQEAFLAVLGKTETAFRLPSAVCHFLAVIVTYLAGSSLRDRSLGGLAALLLAWHPEAVDEVRIARCYGLVLLMASLVVWCTVRWVRFPPQRRWPLAWTVAAAGLMWTHYTSALLVILAAGWIGICSLRTRRPMTHVTRWVLSMLALALICVPLIPSVLRLREWGPFLNYMSADQPLWNFVGAVWWLGLPSGWLVARLTGRRSIHQIKQQKTKTAENRSSWMVLTVCSLLPLLIIAALASGELSSLANPRYRVAYVPAGACLIAVLLTTKVDLRGALLGTMVVIAASWFMAPLWPWELGRLGSATDAEWHDANLFLAAHSSEEEPIYVQSGLAESHLVPAFPNDRLFLEYVACRVSRFYVEAFHPRFGLPFQWDGPGHVQAEFRSHLLSRAKAGDTFWIVAATDTDLNQNSFVGLQRLATESGFVLQQQQSWPNVRVERYVIPNPEAP